MQKQSFELIKGFAKNNKVIKIVKQSHQSNLAFFISLFWMIPMALHKHKDIQLIHCNDGTCGLLCAWVKLITRVPITLTYHGLDLVYPNRIYQKILLPLVKSLDGFICVSKYTAAACKNKGFESSKVFTVPNGVDTTLLPAVDPENELSQYFNTLKANGKKLIVSIGRPVKRKGFSWFIKNVLSELSDDVHYIVIGPRPKSNAFINKLKNLVPTAWLKSYQLLMGVSTDSEVILNMAEQVPYKNRFDWLSNVDYKTLRYMLSQSDVFVMPNISVEGDAEGFGLVALESIMEGTPVIASRIEGITSAIHHWQNGILVTSQNCKEWKSAIESQLKCSKEEVYAQTQHAQLYVKNHFPWSRMVKKYATCFNQIIELGASESWSAKRQYS